jgi:hypothetical protein
MVRRAKYASRRIQSDLIICLRYHVLLVRPVLLVYRLCIDDSPQYSLHHEFSEHFNTPGAPRLHLIVI